MILCLPVPPSANRWWRNINGRMVLSREARNYKAAVALASMGRLRRIASPAPVEVIIRWHRARKAGDLDKRLGVLLDALQGIAYESDAQVARLEAQRFEDPRAPRVEVEVWPWPRGAEG